MIIRATQKKMMSKPVTSTDDGRNVAQLLACPSGQPSVEWHHSAEREPGVEHVLVLREARGSRPSFARACARASASSRAT